MQRYRLRAPFLVSVLCLVTHSASADAGDPFEVITRASNGRTLGAELVDLDGDGRSDLLQLVSTAPPPNEDRLLRVYLQNSRGELPEKPTFERPLPKGSAAYDLADLRKEPGVELVLLNQQGVAILSLGSRDAAVQWYEIGATTLGAGHDERGLEPLPMVFESPGHPAWIAVPSFNGPVVLDAQGELIGRIDSPGRANYFIPQKHGLAFMESDVQLFFDAPHLSIGDVDGDGLADLITSTRHALKVYSQTSEGLLPSAASQTLEFDLISERDHIRGSGGVVGETADVNGDGRLDLLLTTVGGTFSSSTVDTRIYLNRKGTWNLDKPDDSYRSEGAIGSDSLMDLDGDGRPELLRATIKMSVLELIEVLVTRALDIEVEIFRGTTGQADRVSESGGVFDPRASARFKIAIPLSFDTFRPAGFLANLKADLNGDGYRDLVRSGHGDEISLYPGGPDSDFGRRSARQKVDTRGELSFGDWNGDGLPDLLLFDPKIPEVPIRLLINRTKPDRAKSPSG